MAGNIDVENDGLYLRHLLHDSGYPDIADLIKKALDSVIPKKAIDFRTNVARVITQCLQSNGVPMFRTTYAKQPFPENTVLVICYLGKLRGTWLKNTPTEDLQLLRSKADGYTLMLRKYGQYFAGPAGSVSLGGAATYTGQAIVSEAAGELQYLLNGKQIDFEEFSKAWLRDFPNQEIPRKSFHRIGMTNEFTVSVQEHGALVKETALEAHLMEIENRLKDALADEEKAVPFYQGLKNDIEGTLNLVNRKETEKYRYLYATMQGVGAILVEETRHRDKIKNLIPAIQELRKVIELERTTGKPQVLRPLERI